MLDIKNATGCSKQRTCVTASKLLQMFYCNSWNCPPILWTLPLYTLYTYTICMCVCTMWNGRKNCWNAFAAWLLRWFFMIAARTQYSSCCSVQHDRDSNSNRNRDSDSDSCLCPMRGATMLFAVSQISWSLLECHRYFPFVFCLIFPSLSLSLSLSQSIYDCHVCGSCGFTFYTFKPYDVTAFPPLPYLELSVMRSLGIPAVGN